MNLFIVFFNVALAMLAAPLMWGITYRVKAWFAGRHGPPLLQLYYDIAKLMRRGCVYSRTTTPIFKIAPAVCLGSVLVALILMPGAGISSWFGFKGDLILLIYLLGIGRFFMVLAALDTGSTFEGMGAAREIQFAAFIEPSFILVMAVVGTSGGGLSLSSLFGGTGYHNIASTILAAGAMMMIYLVENARIPFDDPDTHLELTMIHEVMILDHSGPDLALMHYASSLKVWLYGMLVVMIALPTIGLFPFWLYWCALLVGISLVAVITGIIESAMARFALLDIPHILLGIFGMALLSLAFLLYR